MPIFFTISYFRLICYYLIVTLLQLISTFLLISRWCDLQRPARPQMQCNSSGIYSINFNSHNKYCGNYLWWSLYCRVHFMPYMSPETISVNLSLTSILHVVPTTPPRYWTTTTAFVRSSTRQISVPVWV